MAANPGTRIAYIGLGSNLGDRQWALQEALNRLRGSPGIQVRAVSPMIQTQPAGGPPGQPTYLNAAAELEVTLTPRELLGRLMEIEQALGRRREQEERWGPRVCDLDILLIDNLIIDTPELVIPHPRMHRRRFVLEPLAAIAPLARHPVRGKTVAQMLADLENAP
jgi:2-amino-4-hydroxy-6-hydroxymethyldihydropteridine diphosphokinase